MIDWYETRNKYIAEMENIFSSFPRQSIILTIEDAYGCPMENILNIERDHYYIKYLQTTKCDELNGFDIRYITKSLLLYNKHGNAVGFNSKTCGDYGEKKNAHMIARIKQQNTKYRATTMRNNNLVYTDALPREGGNIDSDPILVSIEDDQSLLRPNGEFGNQTLNGRLIEVYMKCNEYYPKEPIEPIKLYHKWKLGS